MSEFISVAPSVVSLTNSPPPPGNVILSNEYRIPDYYLFDLQNMFSSAKDLLNDPELNLVDNAYDLLSVVAGPSRFGLKFLLLAAEVANYADQGIFY